MLTLKIKPNTSDYWRNHPTYQNAVDNEDCGLDIPMQNSVLVPANSNAFTVNLEFKAEQNHAYMLVPRSSISKTPLRLANSIGIIDKNYRGYVMVKVDNISDNDFEMKRGSCYFQIVAFDGNLPSYKLVKNISDTKRGEGGFGSTTQNNN